MTSGGEADPQTESAGLFGPESLFWQVWQESVMLLGSGCAILLQLAHPLVAAGVADHSYFHVDPLGRLDHTLDTMLAIIFGNLPQAEAALRRLHAAHVPVKGHLVSTAGPFPAGIAYTAQDPVLKLWVHATLIDTGLKVYAQFVGPLSPTTKASFYEDARLVARRMGIPNTMIPSTVEDFKRYMEDMLASDTLVVTDTARTLSRAVLHPALGAIHRTIIYPVGFITTGLLPERLRQAYGLTWDARRQARLEMFSRTVRLLLPLTPAALRFAPQARQARKRLQLIHWNSKARIP
ncbi:MAG: DUF2236 domain-containing protein [Chloroflexi bacterium]|nr:DUF2236 domain-containing protein [Chloroflexota bacterium]